MQTDDDLVERLQSLWPTGCGDEIAGATLMDEAATRISELEAEIARLRAGADDQEPVAWMEARAVISKLVMVARTSGGTAGPDISLREACEDGEMWLAKYPAATTTARPETKHDR